MIRRARRRPIALAAGAGVVAVVIVIAALDPGRVVQNWRERAFDRFVAWSPRTSPPARPPVLVVDIDRDSVAAGEPWPWRRARIARLVDLIASGRPAAVAIDALLVDRGDAQGDAVLAASLRAAPSVIAVLLDPERPGSAAAGLPIVVMEPRPVLTPLAAVGLATPSPVLAEAARALGVASLPSPDGEPVRTVPLLAFADGLVMGGFALEAARVALGDGMARLGGEPSAIRLADRGVPLAPDARLRLHFAEPARQAARTVSARRLLEGDDMATRIDGAVVLIGSSAPEAGGLRETAVGPFTPSVQIQAEAVEQLLAGWSPQRLANARTIELATMAILGMAAVALAAFWSPVAAAIGAAALILAWGATCFAIFRHAALLVDPLAPATAAALGFQASALAGFATARRERAAIMRRFAQHLAPEVVRRIADDPTVLRLDGEARVVTALFTDIEGFTALAERAAPADLIALLDLYFDTVSAIVVAHGGMVDKFVGDAVHAFFNAPVDLNDHVARALVCARAIARATEDLRTSDPLARALALGRTRIGVESGPAVVGEVGGSLRLDYTAHGPAINAAAKLEAANKRFGTTILVGPGAAAALLHVGLREAGRLALSEGGAEIVAWTPVDL